MAKLAYLNDDFHVKVCTVVISFFLRFLLTDCCPEKHNTERVIFSLKMPHLLSAYYEIVTLNKKNIQIYRLQLSVKHQHVYFYVYFCLKLWNLEFTSAQWAEFSQIWYHWTTPVIWMTDQLSQSIKIWQSAVSQVNWARKRPLYMPYFSWTIHFWYCTVKFKAHLTIIFY